MSNNITEALKGKFYSQKYTGKLFTDFEEAYDCYNDFAETCMTSMSDIANTEMWMGQEATTAKELIGTDEYDILQDILGIQQDMNDLALSISEKFTQDVDSDSNAYINCTDLDTVNEFFRGKYYEYCSLKNSIDSIIQELNDNYGNYGSFSAVDTNSTITAYENLCGGSIINDGYIYSCLQKFLLFNREASELIVKKGLDKRISDVLDAMNKKYSLGLTDEDIAATNVSETLIRDQISDVETINQLQSILTKDSTELTKAEIEFIAETYKEAVDSGNTEILEALYQFMMVEEVTAETGADGEEYYEYHANIDVLLALQIADYMEKNMGAAKDSTYIENLGEMATISTEMVSDKMPSSSISIEKNEYGLLINWNINVDGENQNTTQRMIWDDSGLTTEERLEKIEKLDGVQQYRVYLKNKNEQEALDKLENDAVNADDFDDYAGEKHKFLFIDQKTVDAYINGFWKGSGVSVSNVEGTYFMRPEEVEVYNYYCATDRSKAREYLELLSQQLAYRAGMKGIYEQISDSKAKTIGYEIAYGYTQFGSGISRIIASIKGETPEYTAMDVADAQVQSHSFGTVHFSYHAAEVFGEAIPLIIILICTYGAGGVAEGAAEGGSAAFGAATAEEAIGSSDLLNIIEDAYAAADTYGNAYTDASRNGNTTSASREYAFTNASVQVLTSILGNEYTSATESEITSKVGNYANNYGSSYFMDMINNYVDEKSNPSNDGEEIDAYVQDMMDSAFLDIPDGF